MSQNIGKITRAVGPVVDVRFEDGHLPSLNTAIVVQNGDTPLTIEVAQHLGDDTVRCIAMGSTDGLRRGLDAVDTGAPISVPVGEETLGRYIETGKLVHNSKCNCPDCRIERFEKNPEEELKKSLDRLANMIGTVNPDDNSIQFPDGGEEINKFLAHLFGDK